MDFLSETPTESSSPARWTPNAEQVAVISAPIDENQRVLAGPGAGKTLTISLRYERLVDAGVSPDNIVAVTYSSKMAKELLSRIATTTDLTDRGIKQICTIHALCFRTLRAEGMRRDVPKEWQQKKLISEIAEELWENPSARPAWKELERWIALPKTRGITSADDGRFYGDAVGDAYTASKLHKARAQYDMRMSQNGWIDFTSMVFEMEQRLIRDRDFRVKYQSLFTHIIVDEAQDTSAQALRILITLSLEPGDNRVYSGWRPV